ncbi:pectin methylesterase, family CE8 [Zostera marina]|uniref:Pectinesterase n=1 Tax=Zostera marina TaxID=29655 RepID=A0A0K9Q5H0_ZOSMR|nr:pectin methylesterase, family CE8 [Zostera marina]
MNLNRHLLHLFAVVVVLTASGILRSDARNGDYKREMKQWCETEVPYSHSCLMYTRRTYDGGGRMDRSVFFQFSLQAALSRAILAGADLRRMRKHSKYEENVWIDCEKLYSNTVIQLNRTVLSMEYSRPCDFQTWLSAALTNVDMCSKIFETDGDGTPDSMKMIASLSSLSKYNVPELISNCLAINEPLVLDNATANYKLTETMRRNLGSSVKADIVVAKDGSGRYNSVAAAVAAGTRMRRRKGKRLVIYVKSGVYSETVNIPNSMDDVTLIGDGKGKTIITGRRSVKSGYTMITCATVAVFGDGFVAKDLTFRNTYGPGSQGVALLVASDSAVIHRASIEGYQDTLCVFSQRQFYRDCDIYGTIDFIFGNAAVVIQKCNIYARKPLHGESNVITAQARTDPNQNTGIIIQFCKILSSKEFWPVHRTVKSYLGRPWKKYARTVYLQSYISGIIDPKGWMPWRGSFALDTLYYAEFKNTGFGSRRSRRVKWSGYHIIRSSSSLTQFTVKNFIAGGMWIPNTGTPFKAAF